MKLRGAKQMRSQKIWNWRPKKHWLTNKLLRITVPKLKLSMKAKFQSSKVQANWRLSWPSPGSSNFSTSLGYNPPVDLHPLHFSTGAQSSSLWDLLKIIPNRGENLSSCSRISYCIPLAFFMCSSLSQHATSIRIFLNENGKIQTFFPKSQFHHKGQNLKIDLTGNGVNKTHAVIKVATLYIYMSNFEFQIPIKLWAFSQVLMKRWDPSQDHERCDALQSNALFWPDITSQNLNLFWLSFSNLNNCAVVFQGRVFQWLCAYNRKKCLLELWSEFGANSETSFLYIPLSWIKAKVVSLRFLISHEFILTFLHIQYSNRQIDLKVLSGLKRFCAKYRIEGGRLEFFRGTRTFCFVHPKMQLVCVKVFLVIWDLSHDNWLAIWLAIWHVPYY